MFWYSRLCEDIQAINTPGKELCLRWFTVPVCLHNIYPQYKWQYLLYWLKGRCKHDIILLCNKKLGKTSAGACLCEWFVQLLQGICLLCESYCTFQSGIMQKRKASVNLHWHVRNKNFITRIIQHWCKVAETENDRERLHSTTGINTSHQQARVPWTLEMRPVQGRGVPSGDGKNPWKETQSYSNPRVVFGTFWIPHESFRFALTFSFCRNHSLWSERNSQLYWSCAVPCSPRFCLAQVAVSGGTRIQVTWHNQQRSFH